MTPMDNTVTASMDSQGTVQLNVLKDNQSYQNLLSGKKVIMFPQSSRKTKVPKDKSKLFSGLNDALKGRSVDWMAEQCYLINFVENSQISHN